MPYYGSETGLYLVIQKSAEKGVDHYGILDRGNLAKNPHVHSFSAVVIHLMPPRLRVDWFQEADNWTSLGKIVDETGAIRRLQDALSRPNYNPLFNNCEHFARYVATGRHESTQVQAAVTVAGLVALPFALSALSNTDSRRYRRR